MKMSQLIGQRVRDTPKDAQTPSHIFLLRGGYVRMVSAGIYSLLPIAKRITAKIEQILREEMDQLGAQEILMPVVLPQELWEESGRAISVGSELLRFQDRNGKNMLLGMTHEEAVCHLVRTEVSSYKQLPVIVYQLQTKYRDEARPRAGLIRVREFTMKDAYSFHSSIEDLHGMYERVHHTYERIFKRIGLPEVISIESDSGMMGGAMSHEFMAIADCGEDTLFVSPDGSYRANREVARCGRIHEQSEEKPLCKVHTPGSKTIQDLASFLNLPSRQTCKAVFYQDESCKLVFVNIRGDLEVNESKLKKVLQIKDLTFAEDTAIRAMGAEPGYASLLEIDATRCHIVVDPSVAESSNLVVGANEIDYHFLNFNFRRDTARMQNFITVADISMVKEGDLCPITGEPLLQKRGIEVGNIFQLGTKYSESMKVHFLDASGKKQPMLMGCYGIGVGRTMASVIEQCHDNYGPIWPISIAPWHVHICALNPNKSDVGTVAEQLYQRLGAAGIETILDDRGEKAGFMFNDADLMGVPFRITISPQTLEQNCVEFKSRGNASKTLISLDSIEKTLRHAIDEAMQALR